MKGIEVTLLRVWFWSC